MIATIPKIVQCRGCVSTVTALELVDSATALAVDTLEVSLQVLRGESLVITLVTLFHPLFIIGYVPMDFPQVPSQLVGPLAGKLALAALEWQIGVVRFEVFGQVGL